MTGHGGWSGYVAGYHDANPGITEDVLDSALDEKGRNPYDWLLEAVPPDAAVVDLACGNGPLLSRMGGRVAVGVDRSAGELTRARRDGRPARLVRADAASLPLAGGTADAVTASMALMVMAPAGPVLAEAARVLRRGGVLAATVPSRSAAAGRSGFTRILADLGQAGVAYPEPLDGLSQLLGAAGFELGDDASGSFVRPVRSRDDAGLVVRSFYAPGAGDDDCRRAADRLWEEGSAGGIELAYPIRRIVATRR